jgi:hypothetical protein
VLSSQNNICNLQKVYILFGKSQLLRNKLLETRGLPNGQFLVRFLNVGRALKPCLERMNEIQRNTKKLKNQENPGIEKTRKLRVSKTEEWRI